ncbi:MAG: hypothetical protein HRT74_13555 [Flavobacteriales bacterium]|nr:hypothetical protein [Flavobacteriales bacterium]
MMNVRTTFVFILLLVLLSCNRSQHQGNSSILAEDASGCGEVLQEVQTLLALKVQSEREEYLNKTPDVSETTIKYMKTLVQFKRRREEHIPCLDSLIKSQNALYDTTYLTFKYISPTSNILDDCRSNTLRQALTLVKLNLERIESDSILVCDGDLLK